MISFFSGKTNQSNIQQVVSFLAQVGLGPPLVLGGEGRAVPPPSAAVFVIAKPAAPTVLSVFAR
jgi:hypothetical protein